MRSYLIKPSTLFFENRAYRIEPANGFGGFCKCGGFMNQLGWVNNWVMIAECESCWKVEAFVYDNFKFVKRFELEVIGIIDFLKEILTESELDSIFRKVKGLSYNYSSFSRAKKKLEEINLDINFILNELRTEFSK